MPLPRKLKPEEITGAEEIGGTVLHPNGMRERIVADLMSLALAAARLRNDAAVIAVAAASYIQQHINDFRGPKGDRGDAGAPGSQGAAGASGTTLVGAGAIARSSLLSAGIRTDAVTLTLAAGKSIAKDDGIDLTPVTTAANPNGLPAGYTLCGACATGANTVVAFIDGPALALGASYSISVKVWKKTG